MKSLISNHVTKILFSSEKTRKLINEGTKNSSGGEQGGWKFFRKKISGGAPLFGT